MRFNMRRENSDGYQIGVSLMAATRREIEVAMTVILISWPASVFDRVRRSGRGWRTEGVMISGEVDCEPVEPSSPPMPPVRTAHTEVAVKPKWIRGIAFHYPFVAAAINPNRLARAREKILADTERKAISVRAPTWAIEYMRQYQAHNRSVTRQDIVAEALALFAAVHPLPPEPENERG